MRWLLASLLIRFLFFFFQAEDGIRYLTVTGVQTCALPISSPNWHARDRVSQFGEVNAPRQSGRLAPAAARGEAALTTDCLPQRHARRERVRHLPERKFVTTYQERARQKPAEEAAVPNAARTQEVERDETPKVARVLRLRDH